VFKRKKEVEIIRQDENSEFRRILFEAQEKYPDDREKQIKHIESYRNEQFNLLGKITITQMEYSVEALKSKDIELDAMCIETMLRGILDMARHMQSDLPDGVYSYINNKIETFMDEILKQVK
jgi:hypothetical protein